MKTLGLQRWTVGDAVRLAVALDTHLGRLPADTPGTVVKLEFGRRVCVRLDSRRRVDRPRRSADSAAVAAG